MANSITGTQRNVKGKLIKPSKITCIDVAALFTSMCRIKNTSDIIVLSFCDKLYKINNKDLINANVLTTSKMLAKLCGGGTNCSLPLQYINENLESKKIDNVIIISDNESWLDADGLARGHYYSATTVLNEWNTFVKNQKRFGNVNPKLIYLDI